MKARHPIRRTALAAALAAALPAAVFAAPGTTSAYNTDKQNTHVEDATSEGVNQVNMITCIMTSLRPDALVNQGNYLALVDKNKCDASGRSSTSNSSSDSAGSSSAPSYMNAIVNSTRASNSDPMMVKTWIDEVEKDHSATIFVHTTATEAPSSSNPYGVFRLDYCGKGSTGPCMMRGYLQGSTSGIDYFEIEGGGGGGSNTRALTLTTSGADSGAGKLQMSEMGTTVAYSFAYNASYFRRSDGTNDQCFSRDASDPETGMSVWSYGLYDSNGDRVNLNSGFPVDYTAGDGTVYHGHMGYWGLWMPPSANIANGATVQRVQYSAGQEPTKTNYTLLKAEGRLTKYTKKSRTLNEIDKIKFQTWVGNVTGFFSGATPNTQYEMYWDDTAGVFKVTGMVDCNSGNGCQTKDLDAEQSVAPAFFSTQGGARGFSQALGGELFVALAGVSPSTPSSSINVIYRVQDLVYPADMPATLYCLRDCPTAATMASYFASGSADASPFVPSSYNNWNPTAASGLVSYSSDSASAALLDASSAPVTFTDSAALQSRPQYQWGVRTGRLFTSLAAAQCANDATHYCDYKVEEMDTYYQWETGPNQWNQFAAVKDSGGNVVTFDAPLQVSYSVPSGAAYGPYAGKSLVLQYGGFGELWGIPGHCVSHLTNDPVSCDTQNSRYVPAFVIPFDQTLGQVMNGATPLLAKWLDREIRFARKDLSVCTGAGVTLPTGLTLPTAAGLADPTDPASSIYVGDKPTVTDAPRVIQGEVKY